MVKNIKLEIEYEGTNFLGWQVQKQGRTVQGELQKALEKLLKQKINLIGAGRTDAGVHALGQIANFKTKSKLETERILRALNNLLPKEIVVKKAEEVNSDFNARFKAKSRVYRYRIYLGKSALLRKSVWQVFQPLDINKMKRAIKLVKGYHDFSHFGRKENDLHGHKCQMLNAKCQENGSEVAFEFEANRFLRGMVRGLVGSLVQIGRGSLGIKDFSKMLNGVSSKKAIQKAPAAGVYLVKVKY